MSTNVWPGRTRTEQKTGERKTSTPRLDLVASSAPTFVFSMMPMANEPLTKNHQEDAHAVPCEPTVVAASIGRWGGGQSIRPRGDCSLRPEVCVCGPSGPRFVAQRNTPLRSTPLPLTHSCLLLRCEHVVVCMRHASVSALRKSAHPPSHYPVRRETNSCIGWRRVSAELSKRTPPYCSKVLVFDWRAEAVNLHEIGAITRATAQRREDIENATQMVQESLLFQLARLLLPNAFAAFCSPLIASLPASAPFKLRTQVQRKARPARAFGRWNAHLRPVGARPSADQPRELCRRRGARHPRRRVIARIVVRRGLAARLAHAVATTTTTTITAAPAARCQRCAYSWLFEAQQHR